MSTNYFTKQGNQIQNCNSCIFVIDQSRMPFGTQPFPWLKKFETLSYLPSPWLKELTTWSGSACLEFELEVRSWLILSDYASEFIHKACNKFHYDINEWLTRQSNQCSMGLCTVRIHRSPGYYDGRNWVMWCGSCPCSDALAHPKCWKSFTRMQSFISLAFDNSQQASGPVHQQHLPTSLQTCSLMHSFSLCMLDYVASKYSTPMNKKSLASVPDWNLNLPCHLIMFSSSSFSSSIQLMMHTHPSFMRTPSTKLNWKWH